MPGEDDAFNRCRALIGFLVCQDITEEEFAVNFVDCLADAPIMAAKRATRGMLSSHLELLLPNVELLESAKGIRHHRGFINDGMDDRERKNHYEKTASHILDVCTVIRNNHRKSVEQGVDLNT